MAGATPEAAAGHGLTPGECARIPRILGREPSPTELGIFSAMWSEHCSYKSSRALLRRLPTEAPWVIDGPGENAGVVDIGDGLACVFKIESHNHPSFIEPRQGAATGVGGILRDVFTMGARPVALLNALRFGSPDHPLTRHLLGGVVEGVGGYGNCVGVPTVGGEVGFDAGYDGNILVNAMAVGVAERGRIFRSAAGGPGNAVVYAGSRTGRDGIHGATMASAGFSGDPGRSRPTVQVGDPFTGKLLLEACLELMATGGVVAIQDMGAAGLTSSSVEMSDKGGVGIELDLDRVPVREDGMTAYEIMLSESQERMLMVLEPGQEPAARGIFAKWELDLAVIGSVTDTGRLVLTRGGRTEADIPVAPLVAEAPECRRPARRPAPRPPRRGPLDGVDAAPVDALLRLVSSPDLCSRRWVWEQYDSSVMGDTVHGPGGDAAVVRIHGTARGLAMTTDCTPRYCAADPVEGGRQAVAEAWRNLTAAGAQPLAATNNLNFGSPERPEVMGQLEGCVEGMAEACRALDFPVVSGNVSLYNETDGVAIPPTPVVGGVGVVADVGAGLVRAALPPGQALAVVGRTAGHLHRSALLRVLAGRDDGPPPPVDLAAERRNGDLVRRLAADGLLGACHDVSDGGVLVAVAEMAMAGGVGARLAVPPGAPPPLAWLFGEDQARYVVATAEPARLLAAADAAGVPAAEVGATGGDVLTVDGHGSIPLAELRGAHEGWLPSYMSPGAPGTARPPTAEHEGAGPCR